MNHPPNPECQTATLLSWTEALLQDAGTSPVKEPHEGEQEDVFISIQAFPALLDITPSCDIRSVSCGSRHTAAVTSEKPHWLYTNAHILGKSVIFIWYFLFPATGDLYTWGWGKFEFELNDTQTDFKTVENAFNQINDKIFIALPHYQFKYLVCLQHNLSISWTYLVYHHFRRLWPTWTPDFNQFRCAPAGGVLQGAADACGWRSVWVMEHLRCCRQEGSILFLNI